MRRGGRKNGCFGNGTVGNQRWLCVRCLGRLGHPPAEKVLLPLRLLKWRVSNSFCYFAKMSFLLMRWPSAFPTPLITYSIPPCFIMGLAFLCSVSNSLIKSYRQCEPKREKSSTASEQTAWPMFQLQGVSGSYSVLFPRWWFCCVWCSGQCMLWSGFCKHALSWSHPSSSSQSFMPFVMMCNVKLDYCCSKHMGHDNFYHLFK